MSRIDFQTMGERVVLAGAERYHMRHVCAQMLSIPFNLDDPVADASSWQHPVTKLLPADSYLRRVYGQAQTAYLRTIGAGFDALRLNGEDVPFSDIARNTASQIGGSPMRLLARIDGQCEIYCWVNEEDRSWLSSIIKEGLMTGLYRSAVGWENVIELLDGRSPGPVVCSYSGSRGFPNEVLVGMSAQRWDRISHKEQWRIGIAKLHQLESGVKYGLQLRPDNWHRYIFGAGYSGFHVMELALGME
jgi:hypothetical protein